MGISIASLHETRTVPVTFNGQTAQFVVRPGELTPNFEDKILESKVSGSAALVEMVTKLVVSWELIDDNGNQLPVTPETVGALPIMFLGDAIRQVGEALSPGKAKG